LIIIVNRPIGNLPYNQFIKIVYI